MFILNFLLDNATTLVTIVALLAAPLVPTGIFLIFAGDKRGNPTRISGRTAREYRAIAKRSKQRISGKAGNTWGRVYFVSLMWMACCSLIAVPLYLLSEFALLPVFGTGLPLWLIPLAGFLLGSLLAAEIVLKGKFYVNVRPLYGLKAINPVTGRTHVFLPGFNFSFGPFDRYEVEKDTLSLRADIVTGEESFLTASGVPVSLKPTLRWRVVPQLLLINASHSLENVRIALEDFFVGAMSRIFLATTIEQTQNAAMIERLEAQLLASLEGLDGRNRDTTGSTFEEAYGLAVEASPLGIPTPAKDFIEAKMGSVTMALYATAVNEMRRLNPGLSETEALNAVMMNAKEAITKVIHEIAVDPRLAQAAGDLGEILKIGGPGIAALLATMAGGKGSHGADPHAAPHH